MLGLAPFTSADQGVLASKSCARSGCFPFSQALIKAHMASKCSGSLWLLALFTCTDQGHQGHRPILASRGSLLPRRVLPVTGKYRSSGSEKETWYRYIRVRGIRLYAILEIARLPGRPVPRRLRAAPVGAGVAAGVLLREGLLANACAGGDVAWKVAPKLAARDVGGAWEAAATVV